MICEVVSHHFFESLPAGGGRICAYPAYFELQLQVEDGHSPSPIAKKREELRSLPRAAQLFESSDIVTQAP